MYIIDAKRTPIGKFLGSLSQFSAPDLTKPLFEYFLKTYPFLKTATDEVILGNVLQAGIGMNPARIASIKGGMSEKIPAYTINQVCASGLNAVIQGFRLIKSGQGEIVLVGGMESMSNAPYVIKGARKGLKYGSEVLVDSLQTDGLFCSLSNILMGETAENVAKKYKVSRKAQDEFALESHKKAVNAQKNKIFKKEIIGLNGIFEDEAPRKDTSLEKLAKLNPVFNKKGTVTAGNSSGINDGATLLLVVSQNALKKYNLKPKAKIIDSVMVGLDPKIMGMGPKLAIEKLLNKNKLTVKNIDLFEINEAFASQSLAVIKELKIDKKKVNIYGGAIALGHPLGASGARILQNLITGLKNTKGKLGIASLCVGGGQGVAILIENI